MPERQQITWAKLRVGMMVIASLTIMAVGIFFISGEVGFLSRRYTLRAYMSSASGLREGAEVRLAGIAVGNVEAIRISPYPEPSRAVELILRVTHSYQDQIRADSVASMETSGLLGESYVDISRGGPGQPVVPAGGVVKSSEEADIKRVVQNANDVITNLRALSAKLNDLTEQIQSGKGTIGQLIYDPTVANRLNATLTSAQRIVDRVEGGEGTFGKLMADESLYQRTVATVDRLNNVIDEMQNGKGSMAKFISDPTVFDNVNRLVTHADTFVSNINNGQGSLGKMATDPALYDRANDTFDRMDALVKRIDEGQGTLGKLSTDPALYNNLSDSSQSLRDFLTEFKKNPKKYMTLRLTVF